MQSKVDAGTIKHLDVWCERTFADDVRAEASGMMLRLVWTDEDYWLNRGWTDVALESGAMDLR